MPEKNKGNNNNYLKIGELPRLRILPIADLLFHEEPDKSRMEKLIHRLQDEKILKNPPIVAQTNGTKNFIILDGANRVSASGALGLKDMVVQVVDYDDPLLDIRCWHHAIEKIGKPEILAGIKNIKGVTMVAENGPASDWSADCLCQFIFADGTGLLLKGGRNIIEQLKFLIEITRLYMGSNFFDRVSYLNLEDLKNNYPHFGALVVFRRFDKNDLLDVVDSGIKIPAGISRIFLPKRALGLNIDLDLLKSSLSLEEKNRKLSDKILKMVREKSIRFYREPTFIFDE